MLVLGTQAAQSLAPLTRGRGSVVFVQANILGLSPILVQATTDPAQLLKEIDRACPAETFWVGWIPNETPEALASALAEQHQAAHVRHNWFEPTTELLAYVAHVALPPLRQLIEQIHPKATTSATVSIEEIAQYLGVSVPTIRRQVKAGTIPALRIGRQLRFIPADVLASAQRG